MSPRKRKNRQKKSESLGMALNAAIAVAGIILLGFIYSFSKNQMHQGVPIAVTFPETPARPILAKDVFIQNPILNIKVEVLNGCGIKGIAARTADFLRANHVDVVRSDNANNHAYPNTIIIGRNENMESLKVVAKSFGFALDDKTHILIDPDESLGVDVTVILGKDIYSIPELSSLIPTRP